MKTINSPSLVKSVMLVWGLRGFLDVIIFSFLFTEVGALLSLFSARTHRSVFFYLP